MDRPLPQTFLTLADIFENHGHKLYMIGGSSRDFLLGRDCHDLEKLEQKTIIIQRNNVQSIYKEVFVIC